MRKEDFYLQDETGLSDNVSTDLLSQLRRGPVESVDDLDAAIALADLVCEQFEYRAQSGSLATTLDNTEVRLAMQALRAIVGRLNVEFSPRFRDYRSLEGRWEDAPVYEVWSPSRKKALVSSTFAPLHEALAELEEARIKSALPEPATPEPTGWVKVDEEVRALKKTYAQAKSTQDFSNVGNQAVRVLEALSAEAYQHETHGESGSDEPPVTNTKDRLEAFVSGSLSDPSEADLRKLLRTAIEFAQSVKHSKSPDKKEAALAANSAVMLASLLRDIQ